MFRIFMIIVINWMFYVSLLLIVIFVYLSLFYISLKDTGFEGFLHLTCYDSDFSWNWSCYSPFDAWILTNTMVITDLLLCIMAIFGYLFSIIGSECDVMTNLLNDSGDKYLPIPMQNMFGLSYVLFAAKFFLISSSMIIVAIEAYALQFESYSLLPVGIIIGKLNLWAYGCINNISHVFERDIHDDELTQEMCDVKLDIGDHNDNLNSLSYFKQLRDIWKKHKYWMNNLIITGSCSCTIFGAAKHWNSVDPRDGAALGGLFLVFVFAGFALLCSIISMIMVRCIGGIKYIDIIIAHDNRFRLICFAKTALLIVKQVLVMILSEWIWTTVYSILYAISLCTLAYITFGIDGKFIRLTSILPNLDGKKLYQTYLISYIVTCLSSALTLITSILYFDCQNRVWTDPTQKFAICIIFGPFTWITFAKLYNNEFTRFKSDITILSKNEAGLNTIPSTPRSLYHFQYSVTVSSISMIFGMIFWSFIYVIEDDPRNQFLIIFVLQMIFACIIFVNSIRTLKSLADIQD